MSRAAHIRVGCVEGIDIGRGHTTLVTSMMRCGVECLTVAKQNSELACLVTFGW